MSYNACSSSSLSSVQLLITLFDPLFVFLQEVTLTTEQLLVQAGSYYTGCSNIDINDPNKPGTAVIWKKGLDDTVINIVTLKCTNHEKIIFFNRCGMIQGFQIYFTFLAKPFLSISKFKKPFYFDHFNYFHTSSWCT